MYLEMTASCFVLHNYCNSEDDAISIYYWLFFGTIYSTIVLFMVGLTIATIQEGKQRK
jgi:purine-cytosine permease-like protein